MFTKFFQQPEYLHVLLNHIPLTGLAVGLFVLAGGMVSRQKSILYMGLIVITLTSLVIWPVAKSGSKAYDGISEMVDKEGRKALEAHEILGEQCMKFYYITAAVAFIGIGAITKWPKCTAWVSALVILLAVLALYKGFQAAEEGGQIRHKEFRH